VLFKVIKLRKMKWVGNETSMREIRNAYKLLVGKPGRKRSLGRPRPRREDDIKTDLIETGCENVDWIQLARQQ
jgi:hypothetical protein